MFDEDEIISALNIFWPKKKKARKNLQDEYLGGKCKWIDIIKIYEETVKNHLDAIKNNPNSSKREKIARRIIIDSCLRTPGDYPLFYAMPLYVSGGFISEIKKGNLKFPKIKEHVIPLSLCSGTKMIENPELFEVYQKSVIGPICLITTNEDKGLKEFRKNHPNIEKPFLRYSGVIDVYNTLDGSKIDCSDFSFYDHINIMDKCPAYRSAIKPEFRKEA
ncbi:hypothetical protein AA0472_1141 [Acetobacter estunensis NRIC 0472]|uniref:Uncharacterized protein n=1 Tax=Acetobacter estunensis TaxID=104097 RepID=A0A967B3Y3_9PROT|nr:hypothetical protein [Acetobacter estunensis]NHO53292.1 hypothetical protein [Acetobacter estunensis]GBQ23562.1 hypothetical protein AA0472_1141 [Acetobacter estunensis NRIC 0472]